MVRKVSGGQVVALAGVGLIGLLFACGGQNNPTPTPTPTPSPAANWIDRTLISSADHVVVEKVSYLSGGLKIWGEICRPDDASQHSVLLWNHGGFDGLFDGDRQACKLLAQTGFVVAASYYRGEGGSQGSPEACKGEVDDVAAMLAILKQQSYANPSKIAAVGASHGGCVTLSLAIRQPEIKAAVDLAGPSDWAALYNWMADQVAKGEPFCAQTGQTGCAALHQQLLGEFVAAFGGTPAQVPQAYSERSPVNRLADLRVPTLIVHGTDDAVVNLEQTCLLRAGLQQLGRAPGAWFIDRSLHERSSGTACSGGFRSTPVILMAPLETNALVVYEGMGHELSGSAQTHVVALVTAFALAHL